MEEEDARRMKRKKYVWGKKWAEAPKMCRRHWETFCVQKNASFRSVLVKNKSEHYRSCAPPPEGGGGNRQRLEQEGAVELQAGKTSEADRRFVRLPSSVDCSFWQPGRDP